MTFIAPALDGRDPLGFLAAVGTVRLLGEMIDPSARLAFDPITGQAQFAVDGIAGLDRCVAAIQAIVNDLGDAVVPGMPASFPPPGAAPDQMRVPPGEIAEMAKTWADAWGDDVVVHRWVRALVTDIAVDRAGRAAISPFAAPSGKQSFSTMFAGACEAVRNRPQALHEAFVGWRRVPGYTGEYLDHRVLMSSADAPSKSDIAERGVPGATWLALMALPLMPVTADVSGARTAVGWTRIRGQREWHWPLWRRPYSVRAISLLLNHPAVPHMGRLLDAANHDQQVRRQAAELSRLDVFAVSVAARNRIPGRKSDGVLVPKGVVSVSDLVSLSWRDS